MENTLKYRLLNLITDSFGKHIVAGMMKIKEATGIPYRTVQRDVYRAKGQGTTPAERLTAYACFFGCTIDELKNESTNAST